jgi:hypothetical protein
MCRDLRPVEPELLTLYSYFFLIDFHEMDLL